MNYTPNFSMKLPGDADTADIADLNENTTAIDGLIHDNRTMIAQAYSQLESYVVGDIVENEGKLYRCIGATSGNWDSTKWTRTTLGDEVEEAGASSLADLDDVSLTTPTEGQILRRDANGDWVNTDMPDTAVTKTATGNPIEVSDSANSPLVKCVSAITGSQDLHGYDKPWVGGAGKNKFDTDSVYSDTSKYTISNGEVTATAYNFTLAKFNIPSSMVGSPVTFSVLLTVPSETSELFVMATVNGVNNKGASVIASSQGLSSVTFTPTSTNDVVFINYASGGSGVCKASQLQFESGSTPTTFAPYSNICPITAYTEGEIEVSDGDGNTTTHTTTYPSAIYRGSEDCVNGEVTTEWGMIASYAGETLPGEWISDRDEYAPGTTPTTGAQVAYALATPNSASVTPTNLPVKSLNGYSHIESSTGEMEIEYIAKAFSPITEIVDSQISALQKMMELMLTSARETTMTASANYTAGTLIVACGALYKATTAISSGASLVVGTNITPTTIAAEIAALA